MSYESCSKVLDSSDLSDQDALEVLRIAATHSLGEPMLASTVKRDFDRLKSLTNPSIGALLLDGWMSPRMKKMLTISAENHLEDIFNEADMIESSSPIPLSELPLIPWGAYLPPSTIGQHNRRGIHKSFYDGWQGVWEAMGELLRMDKSPTVSSIQQHIAANRTGSDLQNYQHYVSHGGNIEYALDALLTSTQNVLKNGDEGWEYDDYAAEIETLPSTPFDGAFDVARVQLFGLSDHDVLSKMGPYTGF